MRIISGELGGRRFAKEGLFSIIQHNLNLGEIKSLDLFGGTGSISYELYSRGVQQLTIVEKDAVMYEFIKKTAKDLGIEKIQVVRNDVFKFMRETKEKYDFIFAGPPYALGNIEELPEVIFKQELLLPNGWFVLEHTPRNDFKNTPFYKTERKYGTTIFSIFINRPD
jgi:16S rRNA (guanine(966)-N(2))-methyltransferase RsmD